MLILNKRKKQSIAYLLLTAFLFATVSTPYAQTVSSSSKVSSRTSGLSVEKKPDSAPALVFSQLKEQYLQNLEKLKSCNDEALGKQIDAVKNVIAKRLVFSSPLERSNKRYVLGAYQGERSRVSFVIEYAKETVLVQDFSKAMDPFLESLEDSVGTLRNQPLSVSQSGQLALAVIQMSQVLAPDLEVQHVYQGKDVSAVLTTGGEFTKTADVDSALSSFENTVPISIEVEEKNNVIFKTKENWNNELRKPEEQIDRPNLIKDEKTQDTDLKKRFKAAASLENLVFQGLLMGTLSLILSAFTGYSFALLILYSGIGTSVVFAGLHYKVYYSADKSAEKPRQFKHRLALLGLGMTMSALFAGSLLGMHALFQFAITSNSISLGLIPAIEILLSLIFPVLLHWKWNTIAPRYGLPLGMLPVMGKQSEQFLQKYPKMNGVFKKDLIQSNINYLIQLEDEFGKDAKYLFNYTLPAAICLIKDTKSLKEVTKQVQEFARKTENNTEELLKYILPHLMQTFGQKIEGHWPLFVELGRKAENRADVLFQYGLPALEDLINKNENNLDNLRDIGNQLVKLCKAVDDGHYYIVQYCLDIGKNIIKDANSLEEMGNQLLNLCKAVEEPRHLLIALSELKQILGPEEYKNYWPGLVKLGVSLKDNSVKLFKYTLPAVQDLIKNKDDLEQLGKVFMELNRTAGKNAEILFTYGLPLLKSLINNPNDLRTKGLECIKAFKSYGDEVKKNLKQLCGLKYLIRTLPDAWQLFLLPLSMKLRTESAPIFEEIEALYNEGVILVNDDLKFISHLLSDHKQKAYSLLKYFLVPAVQEKLISGPIFKDKEIINEFLANFPYYGSDIYKEYKEVHGSKEQLDQLKERCQSIHDLVVPVIDTKSRVVDEDMNQDPKFLDILINVFPPSGTYKKSRYVRVFYGNREKGRNPRKDQDHPEHTSWAPDTLTNQTFTISMDSHQGQIPQNYFSLEGLKHVLEAVREANQEEEEIKSYEEVQAQLAKDLLTAWRTGMLLQVKTKKDLIKKVFKYAHITHNGQMADKDDVKEFLKFFKNTVKETIIQVVTDCHNMRQKEYFEWSAKKQHGKKSKSSIVNPLEDGSKPELKLDELIGQIYSQLVQKEVEILETKLNKINDFLKKNREDIKLRFVISKRAFHGVFGYNMGVCTTPDEQLWNNPNYFHVIMFDEQRIAQGGIQVLIVKENGEKYLALTGINPSISLLSKVKAEKLYEFMIAYAWQIARALKINQVLIPTDIHIHSNRPKIQQIIASKQYEILYLAEVHEFSYAPYPHSFGQVYQVPAPALNNNNNNNNQTKEDVKEGKQAVEEPLALLPFWKKERIQTMLETLSLAETIALIRAIQKLLTSSKELQTVQQANIILKEMIDGMLPDTEKCVEVLKQEVSVSFLVNNEALDEVVNVMAEAFAQLHTSVYNFAAQEFQTASQKDEISLKQLVRKIWEAYGDYGLAKAIEIHVERNLRIKALQISNAMRNVLIRSVPQFYEQYAVLYHQDWKNMNGYEQEQVTNEISKRLNVEIRKQEKEESTAQFIQRVPVIMGEPNSLPQKCAIVLDLRDSSEHTLERLALVAEAYRIYRHTFPDDQAGLVFIGDKTIIQQFMQENDIFDRDVIIMEDEPEDVLPKLKEAEYIVKVFTGMKAGWPEDTLAYWINKTAAAVLMLEDKEKQRADILKIMVQA